MVRDDASSRSNCETIGAVKRGGVKMNEIIIEGKTTEETVLQKLLHWMLNMSFRFMSFSFKFVTYLILSFTQMIINFIYNKLDLDNWDFLIKREEHKAKLFDIQIDEDDVNYKYRIIRSNEYAVLYNDLKDFLTNVSEGEQAVNIEPSMALDITKKIDKMLFEAEKKCLEEGYNFARETELGIALDEVCREYIKHNVIEGEKGKWRKGN